MALTKNQCRTTIYIYFLKEGWLPAGTTRKTWQDVTMASMEFDEPALPADPDFQKRKIAMDLQVIFLGLGAHIPSPQDLLAEEENTLGELARWCFDEQE